MPMLLMGQVAGRAKRCLQSQEGRFSGGRGRFSGEERGEEGWQLLDLTTSPLLLPEKKSILAPFFPFIFFLFFSFLGAENKLRAGFVVEPRFSVQRRR